MTIRKSINVEINFLKAYLIENTIDLIALAVYCLVKVEAYLLAASVSGARLLVLVLFYFSAGKRLKERNKKFLLLKKLTIVGFWIIISACLYFDISLYPGILLLMSNLIVMFIENCNCSDDVRLLDRH